MNLKANLNTTIQEIYKQNYTNLHKLYKLKNKHLRFNKYM